MSFVVAGVSLFASTAYGMHKGGQQRKAYGQAAEALGQIKETKIGLLTEQRDLADKSILQQFDEAKQQYGMAGEQSKLAMSGAGLGLGMAQSQYASGMEDVSRGVGMGMRGIQQSTAAAAAGSGFARSGTVEQQSNVQTGDLLAKYKSDTQKLFEGKQFAAKQTGLEMQGIGLQSKAAEQQYQAAGKRTMTSREQINQQLKEGKISAEEAMQMQLAGMDPGGAGSGALGGFMSGIGAAAMIVGGGGGGGG